MEWLYFFANPRSANGLEGVASVGPAVQRALTTLTDKGVESVAMLHIPAYTPWRDIPGEEWKENPAQGPIPPIAVDDSNRDDEAYPDEDVFGPGVSVDNGECATEMIQAIRDWEELHPNTAIDVYLVDLGGAFDN